MSRLSTNDPARAWIDQQTDPDVLRDVLAFIEKHPDLLPVVWEAGYHAGVQYVRDEFIKQLSLQMVAAVAAAKDGTS